MIRPGRWLQDSMTRVTSSGQFIPQIDGLRFAAILSVILFHMNGWLFPEGLWPKGSPIWSSVRFLTGKGYYGVELFFMISGFILVLPMAERHLRGDRSLRIKPYLTRRLTRLEPPYILNLLIFWLLCGYPLAATAGNLGASLLYAHGLVFNADSAINHVAWSLEVEVQFYLVAPFLAFVFAIPSVRLRRGVILAAIAGLIWLDAHQQVLAPYISQFRYSTTLLGKGVFFLPGFLLADVYLSDWQSRPREGWLWDVLGLVGWCAIPAALEIRGPWSWLVLAAQWMAFVGVFRGRFFSWLFSRILLTIIGGMCYTLYLYHPRTICLTGVLLNRFLPETAANFLPRLLLMLVMSAVFTLLVCSTLFLLIERPCMRKDWPARLANWCRARLTAPDSGDK